MRKTLLFLAICTSALMSNAQSSTNLWGIGAGIGFTDFQNPIDGQYLMVEKWRGAANLNIARYLGKSFDGRLSLTAGSSDYPYNEKDANSLPLSTDIDNQTENVSYGDAQLWDGGLNLVYKLANGYIFKEDAKVKPYVFSGLGGYLANVIGTKAGVGSDQFNAYVPLGFGLGFDLSDRWGVAAESQYKFALGDAYNMTQTNLRLNHNFGSPAPESTDKMASDDDEPKVNENWCNYNWKVGVGPTFNSFEAVQRAQNFILEDYTTSLGINLTKYMSKWFDARLGLGLGNVFYPFQPNASEPHDGDNWNGTTGGTHYRDAQMIDLNLQAVLKFANGSWMNENAIFSPYVYAGPGLNWITSIGNWNNYQNGPKSYGTDDINAQLGTGLGFNFRTSDKFNIQLEGGRNWRLDNSYSYNQAALRGQLALGQPNCNGEKSTKKNNTKATVIDSDNDGIPDLTDECPYVAGKAEFFGCPDSDGDGIGDSKDKCPFEAGIASNAGCPEKAPVADADGDGIIDANDACPDKAGPASNNGCPKSKVEVTTPTTPTTPTSTKSVIGNYEVFFNSCNTLSAGQIQTLQNVATMLRNNPNYFVEIGGNTTRGGSQSCSEQMANRIASILRQKGVNVSSATTVGYGDSRTKYNNSRDNRAEISIYSFE